MPEIQAFLLHPFSYASRMPNMSILATLIHQGKSAQNADFQRFRKGVDGRGLATSNPRKQPKCSPVICPLLSPKGA